MMGPGHAPVDAEVLRPAAAAHGMPAALPYLMLGAVAGPNAKEPGQRDDRVLFCRPVAP